LLLPDEGNPGLDDFNRFIESHRDRVTFALDSGRSLAEMALVPSAGRSRARFGYCRCRHRAVSLVRLERPRLRVGDRRRGRVGRDAARAALASVPGLREQEAARQHAAKLSYTSSFRRTRCCRAFARPLGQSSTARR
jgi:hypothetical protein